MGTLAEQIRQMIDVLEMVDPGGAAEFRGGSQNRMPIEAMPKAVVMQPVKPAAPRPVPIIRKDTAPGRVLTVLPQNTDPLQLDFSSDNIIRGIIYSEVLGKPVSRRNRHGRR